MNSSQEALAKYAYLKRDLMSDGAKENKLNALNELYYTVKSYSARETTNSGKQEQHGNPSPDPNDTRP